MKNVRDKVVFAIIFSLICLISRTADAKDVSSIKDEIESVLANAPDAFESKLCYLNDRTGVEREKQNGLIWKKSSIWNFVVFRFDRNPSPAQKGECGSFSFQCVLVTHSPPSSLIDWCEGQTNFISPSPNSKSPKEFLNNSELNLILEAINMLPEKANQAEIREGFLIALGSGSNRNADELNAFRISTGRKELSARRAYSLPGDLDFAEISEQANGGVLEAFYPGGWLSRDFVTFKFGTDEPVAFVEPKVFEARIKKANEIFELETNIPRDSEDWDYYFDIAVRIWLGEVNIENRFTDLAQEPAIFLKRSVQ
mgnify:CR=1 FL=1